MNPIDLNPFITYFLTGIGGLVILVVSYYVNRFIRRRSARDALEEAIGHGLSLADGDPKKATMYVRDAMPQQLKTLGVEPIELRQRVEQRASSSRSMVI